MFKLICGFIIKYLETSSKHLYLISYGTSYGIFGDSGSGFVLIPNMKLNIFLITFLYFLNNFFEKTNFCICVGLSKKI